MGKKMGDHVFYRDLRRSYPTLVKGDGVYLYDDDGRRYIDGSSGALVCSLGHGNREVAEFMQQQAEKLAFAPIARFTHGPQAELAERLAKMGSVELPYSYFVSGGSEAVETAVKMARQYHLERGGTNVGRFLVIGRWPSYHGNTLGCLSVGGHASRRTPYAPYLMPSPKIGLPNCGSCSWHLTRSTCDLRCVDALEREILKAGPQNVSCFIMETITGSCGGVILPPPDYLQRVAAICRRYDIVFVADEIMCGAGRTGKFLASSHFGQMPDILILGKGIAAGYSALAALLVSERVYEAFEQGSGAFVNNYTYAANPLSCATACKVLDILTRDRLIDRSAEAGRRLREKLRPLTIRHHVLGTDIRGIGLMIALELYQNRDSQISFPPESKISEKLARACLDEGLVIYPGLLALADRDGDCFLLGPPFIISEPEMDEMVSAIDCALTRLALEVRL